jgi:hypothetical protein
MKKISKKLSMNAILKIKERLEKEIISDSKRIQKIIRTSILGNNTSNVKLSDLEGLKQKKEDQLIELKLTIQKGNLAKHREGLLWGKSNFYYIFKLSVLVADRKHLEYLDDLFSESKKDKVDCEITHEEVLNKLKKVESEIQNIEFKLSKFNHTHTEKVDLDSDLNLA